MRLLSSRRVLQGHTHPPVASFGTCATGLVYHTLRHVPNLGWWRSGTIRRGAAKTRYVASPQLMAAYHLAQ